MENILFLLNNPLDFIDYMDYGFIVFLIFILYRLIRKTEAKKILFGILIIFLFSLFVESIGMERTGVILKKLTEMLIVGLVVLLSVEFRLVLRKIGGITDLKLHDEKDIIEVVEEAVFELSEKKIGALIMFDHDQVLHSQSENATRIDAICSKELLKTIFYPSTDLHDGAVIITGDKIAYAGCKLPLRGNKREGLGHLGTRHLAAIENAEAFDLRAVVVSEETGGISVVTEEGLYRIKSKTMFRQFFNKEIERKKWLQKITKK